MGCLRWLSRCFCRTATRELFFTLIPFGIMFVIFLIVHDWAGHSSTRTQQLIIHHSIAPLRDGIADFITTASHAVAFTKAIVSTGHWRDPYDTRALHEHLYALSTQDPPPKSSTEIGGGFGDANQAPSPTSLVEDYFSSLHYALQMDSFHGRFRRTSFANSLRWVDTKYDPAGDGVRVRRAFLNESSPVLCPKDSTGLDPAERTAPLPAAWMSNTSLTAVNGDGMSPTERRWETGGSMFGRDISAVQFSVDWYSVFGYAGGLRSPSSTFFLCYERDELDRLLSTVVTVAQGRAAVYNVESGQLLSFNLGHLYAPQIPWTPTNFNIDNPVFSHQFDPMRGYYATVRALNANNSYFAVTNGTTQVAFSFLSSLTEWPSGDDMNWRLVTIASTALGSWGGHNTTLAIVENFFGSQRQFVETIRQLIISRRVVDIEDNAALVGVLAPLLRPHVDVMALVHIPFPHDNQNSSVHKDYFERQSVLYRRSDSVLDSFVFSRPEKSRYARLVSYSEVRSTFFSYDMIGPPLVVGTAEAAAATESLPTRKSPSDKSTDWVLVANNAGPSANTDRDWTIYIDDAFRSVDNTVNSSAPEDDTRIDTNLGTDKSTELLSFVFKVDWPASSTTGNGVCNQSGRAYPAAPYPSTFPLVDTSYFKVSYPLQRLRTHLHSLSAYDTERGLTALCLSDGTVLATNAYSTEKQPRNYLWQVPEFRAVAEGHFKTKTSMLGQLCYESSLTFTCSRIQYAGDPTTVFTVNSYRPEAEPENVYYFGLVDKDLGWYSVTKFNGAKMTTVTSEKKVEFMGFIGFMFFALIGSVLLSLYTVDRIARLKMYLKNPLSRELPELKATAWNTEIRDMQRSVAFLRETLLHFHGYVPGGVVDPVSGSGLAQQHATVQFSEGTRRSGGPGGTARQFTDIRDEEGSREDQGFGAYEMETKASTAHSTSPGGGGGAGRSYESITLQAALLKEEDAQGRTQLESNDCFILTLTVLNAETEMAVHGIEGFLPVHDRLSDMFFNEVQTRQGEVIDVSTNRLTAFWISRKSPELSRIVYNRVTNAAANLSVLYNTQYKPLIQGTSHVRPEILLAVTFGPAQYGAIGCDEMRSAILCGPAVQSSVANLCRVARGLGEALMPSTSSRTEAPSTGTTATTGTRVDCIVLCDKAVANFPARSCADHTAAMLPLFAPSVMALRSPSTCVNALIPCQNTETVRHALEQYISELMRGSTGGSAEEPSPAVRAFQNLQEAIARTQPNPVVDENREGTGVGSGDRVTASGSAGGCVWLLDWYARALVAGRVLGVLTESAL